MAKPRRNHTAVNISKLSRYTKTNEIIVVPGKVLGAGKIGHPITVAAFQFSKNAEQKIRAAKGKPLSILHLAQKKPEGSNVKIIG